MKTAHVLIGIVSAVALNACGPSAKYVVGNATPSVASSPQAATAQAVPTVGLPFNAPTNAPLTFSSITMFDANQGWALETDSPAVLHTSDGGTHWQRVEPTKLSENTNTSAFFLNPTAAWLATTTTVGEAVQRDMLIWRTSDAGQTWLTSTLSLQTNGMQPTGGAFSFIDSEHGWVMVGMGAALGSEPIVILRTTDGGAMWQQVALALPDQPAANGIPFGGDKTGMTFSDQMTGWVTLTMPAPGQPIIYTTTNGGASWHPQQLPMPQGKAATNSVSGGYYVFPPIFFTPQTGVLRARLYLNQVLDMLYVTQDGGQTWIARSAWATIEDAAFVDNNDGWLVGQPDASVNTPSDLMHLYRTHDGGQTWSVVAPDRNFQGLTITFADPQHGWAWSTSQPGLLRTTDGGQTWTPLTPVISE